MMMFKLLGLVAALNLVTPMFSANAVALESADAVAEKSVEASKPLALVYWGPGACLTCWASAAQVARKAGFQVKMVGAHFKNFSLLKTAKLWVQPGGKSRTAAKAMGSKYLSEIREFVRNGGSYVGFCAGAFLSTSEIGTSGYPGLGIVPGRTELWDKSDGPSKLLSINWNGNVRKIYYHGGPFIDLTGVNDPNLNVFAHYDDGQINAVRTTFGKGRVAVTGAHPEASKAWKFFQGKLDPDGSDQNLVIVDMIKWTTSQND